MQILRDYQIEAIDQARAVVVAGGHPVLALPTGSGKTTVAAEMIKRAVSRGHRVLFKAHRTELIGQAYRRLLSFGVDAGVIKADGIDHGGERVFRRFEASKRVQVASVQTLRARREHPGVFAWLRACTLSFTDEAHRALAESYAIVRELTPDAVNIGLTATPVRLDGRGLGDVYSDIVYPITVRELVERGYLVEPQYFSHTQPDMNAEGVRIIGGEFDSGHTSRVMGRSEIVGSIVGTYLDGARGRKAVLFASSIKNSKALVAEFCGNGVRAAHVDGATPRNERDVILGALRSGDLDLVSNVDVLTEGWDLPELEVCILARPTASWALHMQMIGRVMRPEGEHPVVLDHAGNLVRHGFPTDLVEFDLNDMRNKRAKGAKAKVCMVCFVVNPIGASRCHACNTVFPRSERAGPMIVDGLLREVKPGKPTAQEKHEYAEELFETARRRGYLPGWVVRRFRSRFGVNPRKAKGFDYPLLKQRAFRACEHARYEQGACQFCGEPDPRVITEDIRKSIKSRVRRNPSRTNVAEVAAEFGVSVTAAYRIAER